MTRLATPCVCAVTARRRLVPDASSTLDEVLGLESFIDDAIIAGVDLLQIREPDLADDILVRLVRSAVGRAIKGSLAQKRPDEMAAEVVRGLLARNPKIDPKFSVLTVTPDPRPR